MLLSIRFVRPRRPDEILDERPLSAFAHDFTLFVPSFERTWTRTWTNVHTILVDDASSTPGAISQPRNPASHINRHRQAIAFSRLLDELLVEQRVERVLHVREPAETVVVIR